MISISQPHLPGNRGHFNQNMPELTGIEFLRALRADGHEMPLGFVTSEGTPSMRQQAAEAGARFLIAKPFTVETFQAELSDVQQKAAAPAGRPVFRPGPSPALVLNCSTPPRIVAELRLDPRHPSVAEGLC